MKMENSRVPVIGVLCIDIDFKYLRKKFGDDYKSYIAASYVKFLESAGAKVIPVWIGKDEEYYDEILSKVNGLLIPGGAVCFGDPENGKCVYSTVEIYKRVLEFNRNGQYFPLWGTCLGHQMIIHAASGENFDSRTDCNFIDASLPLNFVNGFRDSQMFKDLPNDFIEILKIENVAFHFHKYCITEAILKKLKLKKDWLVTSTNLDSNNLEFISTIEHKRYPIYGCQFHPEKPQFETLDKKVVNSRNAIKFSQYFANFFVNETRKNNNKFNEEDELRHLIYNFPVTLTAGSECKWLQCYLFKEDDDYPKS